MALKFSTAVRNAMLDAIETAIGTAPTLEIRTGTDPTAGTVLATMTLPSDWMAAASSGSKALLGTWSDSSADATGTAGCFRILQGATQHLSGTVGTSGADLNLSSTSITSGLPVTITSFTLTGGNA